MRTKPGRDSKTNAIVDSWVKERFSDGRIVGLQGDVWAVRVMPTHSQVWEDDWVKLEAGNVNRRIFEDLSRASKNPPLDLPALESPREFHLLSVRIQGSPQPPTQNPARLQQLQLRHLLAYETARKVDFFAVRLVAQGETVFQTAKRLVRGAVEEETDLAPWDRDNAVISKILGTAGGRIPTEEEWDLLDSWFNGGKGRCRVVEEPSGQRLLLDAWPEGLELSAVTMPSQRLDAPHAPWMMEAFLHQAGVVACSVRGEVKRPETSERMLDAAQRKAIAQDQERQKSSDSVLSDEDLHRAQTAREVGEYLKTNRTGLLSNVSVVFARRAVQDNETFADVLRHEYKIGVSTLVHQQVEGLSEMTLCAPHRLGRTKPTRQFLLPEFVADSGWRADATATDSHGLMIGWAIPEMVPLYVDVTATSTTVDATAGMIVIGDSGSGKTLAMGDMAVQAALTGHVIFINPKPADDLSAMALMLQSWGVPVTVISMGALSPGALDPVSYARSAEAAANIAIEHIMSVITDLSQEEEAALASGIRAGLRGGASCIGDAIEAIEVESIRKRIHTQWQASPKWAVGISMDPVPASNLDGVNSFTLIQFDDSVEPPSGGMTLREMPLADKVALAQVRLVNRAATEMLFRAGGGMIAMDELWRIVSSPYGRQAVVSLLKEGRSQGIMPLYGTQSLGDIEKYTDDKFRGLFSRVLGLHVKDPDEQTRVLEWVGVDVTQERKDFLANAKSRRPGENGPGDPGQPGLGLYRDVRGHHTAIQRGEFSPDYLLWLSTNRADRRRRDQTQPPALYDHLDGQMARAMKGTS